MAPAEQWFGALDQAIQDAADDVHAIFLVAVGPDVSQVYTFEAGDDLNPLIFDGQEHEALGMANAILWSPTPDGESSPAWVGVTVTKAGPFGEQPAFFGVKRTVEDSTWWRLEGPDIPWFLASTASALRAALDQGKPMTMREADKQSDPRLLQGVTPDPSSAPRRHPDGTI